MRITMFLKKKTTESTSFSPQVPTKNDFVVALSTLPQKNILKASFGLQEFSSVAPFLPWFEWYY